MCVVCLLVRATAVTDRLSLKMSFKHAIMQYHLAFTQLKMIFQSIILGLTLRCDLQHQENC